MSKAIVQRKRRSRTATMSRSALGRVFEASGLGARTSWLQTRMRVAPGTVLFRLVVTDIGDDGLHVDAAGRRHA